MLCKVRNIRHIICDVNPLDINGFADNPTNRCYICKKEIFSLIKQVVAENGVNVVAEGSNLDDNGDYRPGMKAIHELGVLSPLQTAGFTKQEIRDYVRMNSDFLLGINRTFRLPFSQRFCVRRKNHRRKSLKE